MPSIFQVNPVSLHDLLRDCKEGKLQLPDFQRGWVWDEDRIKGLLASVSRDFPVGAVMTLACGGSVRFKPRPVEGAPPQAALREPEALILDGQQRLTSLYQVTMRDEVVQTVTARRRPARRWFYLDIGKCLDPSVPREEAIVVVPESRVVQRDFGRDVILDVSTRELEFTSRLFPMQLVFEHDDWTDAYIDHAPPDGKEAARLLIRDFRKQVLERFKQYQMPVISLSRDTSREAVCTVFEKVNTGGRPLDAFELVTAVYAADGYELRRDWLGDGKAPGLRTRLGSAAAAPNAPSGVLGGIANTDILQAISLFHTRERRQAAEAAGKTGKELPQVTGNRAALLELPLEAYKKFLPTVEAGFQRAAQFLLTQRMYRPLDLPYQSQVIPLAAILADLGVQAEHAAAREKIERWFWCGVLGELYGSAIDTRLAKDFLEVPKWIAGGPEPTTVSESVFRSERLKSMRSRLSAAYKGVNALLMMAGATDWRSGLAYDHASFFGEGVDIHHVFPQAWCKKRGIERSRYDSIINKTPLSFRTNRIIGGGAPSRYLRTLEEGSGDAPAIPLADLDAKLRSHHVDPALLRSDDFDAFMQDRQERLLTLIERAMGKPAFRAAGPDQDTDANLDDEADEASA